MGVCRTDTTNRIVHCISEESCLFRVARDGTARSEWSAFSMLMTGARAVADKEKQEKQSESLPLLPEHTVVNKKDQLHNDVLCFLKDRRFLSRQK